jgi:cation diffusion facilitator CzcD-associated flavoprotein CzcO
VRDVVLGETRTRTCNILISAIGALNKPSDPLFDTKDFDGPIFHSSR